MVGVRKDRIPCILPQVVFINCKIRFASVAEDDRVALRLNETGFRMGDNVRECDFGARRRLVCDSNSNDGDGMIEGKPIEAESSSFSRNDDEFTEPRRCRVFEMGDVGDLSRTRSSEVLVRGLECKGGGSISVAEGPCPFGSD